MDIRSLDGDDPAAIADLLPGFRETMSLELPADPPVTEALLTRLFQSRHGAGRLVLAAYDGEEAAGVLKLGFDLGDPGGPGHGSLWVFPGHRGRGHGRALVAAGRAALRSRGRAPLLVDAPAGDRAEGFARAVGGVLTARTVRNRVPLRGPGAGALEMWAARPVPGYRLHRWSGPCPDGLADSYARAWGALAEPVNGRARPRDPSVVDVRAREAEAARAGHRIRGAAVLPEGDDTVVGYSTLLVRDSPMADSGETLVLPTHRRRGLGTWLKSVLLTDAALRHQRLTVVQVFNETGNTAVLMLNKKLGFTADSTWSTYALDA
ncbi:GNAT family N-acetyltransferase [Streptomyces anulatus]|uniref:GNAT family N-acetyltransferase n=1 Tax=Streptomyces anulatus TaxID=1892 RepID=UPI00364AAFAD